MGVVYNSVKLTAKTYCTRLSKSYPTKINSNYYSPFLLDDDEKKTVFMRNYSNRGTQLKASTAELAMNSANETEIIFNTSNIKIAVDMAIANAGATGHFLLPGTQVRNLKPSNKPLTINLLDGK